MLLLLGLLFILVSGHSVTAADTGLVGKFSPTDNRITYFDAACDDDQQAECVVFQLWCVSPASIGFVDHAVSDEALSARLKSKIPARLLSTQGTIDLSPTGMTANDMDGGWDITYEPYTADQVEASRAWFAKLPQMPSLAIGINGVSTLLPNTGKTAPELDAFMKACSPAPVDLGL